MEQEFKEGSGIENPSPAPSAAEKPWRVKSRKQNRLSRFVANLGLAGIVGAASLLNPIFGRKASAQEASDPAAPLQESSANLYSEALPTNEEGNVVIDDEGNIVDVEGVQASPLADIGTDASSTDRSVEEPTLTASVPDSNLQPQETIITPSLKPELPLGYELNNSAKGNSLLVRRSFTPDQIRKIPNTEIEVRGPQDFQNNIQILLEKIKKDPLSYKLIIDNIRSLEIYDIRDMADSAGMNMGVGDIYGDFAGNTTADFKNPLNSYNIAANLVKYAKLTEETKTGNPTARGVKDGVIFQSEEWRQEEIRRKEALINALKAAVAYLKTTDAPEYKKAEYQGFVSANERLLAQLRGQ